MTKFTPAILLSTAMRDPALFGRTFAASSFWTWITAAKLLDGVKLDEREAELFRRCTGRTRLPTQPVRRLTLLGGRRSGKDRFFSAAGVHRAALAADWRQHMSAGEQAVVILLGRDKKQAAILRRYCEGLLQVPLLAQEVTRVTDETIEFRNGSALEIATNDARLVRGRSAVAVLGSECCYWRTDEQSSSSDEEVVSAAEPSMAMCPDGGLLLLGSSVYRKSGYMYRRWQQLHGNNDADDICWLAPTSVMNPSLPQAVIDRATADDPERARAEYLSIWRSDLTDFVPSDVIDESTDFGTRERAPLANTKYVACADAAGGTGTDAFAIAIAHAEPDGTVLLDAVRERRPRFIPAAVIAEYAALLRTYGIRQLLGDRWAIGFHADEWRRHGIIYRACERTTSENYLAALPLLLAGRARLVDNRVLREQLATLERRAHASGRESVSHPAAASAHDDLAASVCGALVAAAQRKRGLIMGLPTGADGFGRVIQVDPVTLQPLNEQRSRLVRDANGVLRIVGGDNTCWTRKELRR